MRALIAFSGAVFVGLGAIILALGAGLVVTAGADSFGAGLLALPWIVGGGTATILIGGLTWIATQQDARLERIEALLRHRFTGSAAPEALPVGGPWSTPARTIVLGTDQPGPMPANLDPLPRPGTEAAPGWYHRAFGPASVWHPGGPVSDDAHQRL